MPNDATPLSVFSFLFPHEAKRKRHNNSFKHAVKAHKQAKRMTQTIPSGGEILQDIER